MIIENQIVQIKWNSRNKTYYESKGYIFTKMGNIFDIKIEHLTNGSKALVRHMCDYCNEEFLIQFVKVNAGFNCCSKKCKYIKIKQNNLEKYGVEYISQREDIKEKKKQTSLEKYGVEYISQREDIKEKKKQTSLEKYGVECTLQSKEIQEKIKNSNLEKYGVKSYTQTKECQDKKRQTNLKRYGVEYTSQLEEVKEKVKQTNTERYGVEYYSQTKKCQDKMKQTNLERYSVEYALQSEEIMNKFKQTCIERYGVENYSQTKECQDKMKKTCMERYGVDNIQKDPIIHRRSVIKSNETLCKNGNRSSSKQQDYLCKLLNGENNYPIDTLSLDIAYPNEMLYIEYNGGGHYAWANLEITKQKDIKRYYYLKSLGWKLIAIISKKDKLLTNDKIIQLITECKEYLNNGHSWIEINIDENLIKCNSHTKNIEINEYLIFDYEKGEFVCIKKD